MHRREGPTYECHTPGTILLHATTPDLLTVQGKLVLQLLSWCRLVRVPASPREISGLPRSAGFCPNQTLLRGFRATQRADDRISQLAALLITCRMKEAFKICEKVARDILGPFCFGFVG